LTCLYLAAPVIFGWQFPVHFVFNINDLSS
jgi:hypothetical protein